MKKKEIEKQLRECGWWFDRHGSNHDVWTNGELLEFVPRHGKVKETLKMKILKKIKNNPPKDFLVQAGSLSNMIIEKTQG